MSSRRRRSRRNLYLLIGAVALSGLLLLLAVGAYPLAVVNGRVLWASTYRSYVASALAYQQAAHDTYGASSTSLLAASAQGEQALALTALDELVEQKIVEHGLDELVGDNAAELVENKIEDLAKEPQLPGASRALFQLDPASFREAILRPQAAREVLAGRVFIDGKTLEQWLAESRQAAKVRILSSTYRWEGGRVQAE